MTGKILLVEDEVFYRDHLVDELQYHGYDVEAVVDATSALVRLDGPPVAVVLLDILMDSPAGQSQNEHGMGGLAVLRAARCKWPGVPVILLTKLGGEDIEKTCRELGAADYIVKGRVRTHELIRRIEAARGAGGGAPYE